MATLRKTDHDKQDVVTDRPVESENMPSDGVGASAQGDDTNCDVQMPTAAVAHGRYVSKALRMPLLIRALLDLAISVVGCGIEDLLTYEQSAKGLPDRKPDQRSQRLRQVSAMAF
jgi:hypothetical protein